MDDLRHAWRFASGWIAGAGVALIEGWNQLPAETRAALPEPVAHAVPTVLLVAVIVGRLVKQKAPTDVQG